MSEIAVVEAVAAGQGGHLHAPPHQGNDDSSAWHFGPLGSAYVYGYRDKSGGGLATCLFYTDPPHLGNSSGQFDMCSTASDLLYCFQHSALMPPPGLCDESSSEDDSERWRTYQPPVDYPFSEPWWSWLSSYDNPTLAPCVSQTDLSQLVNILLEFIPCGVHVEKAKTVIKKIIDTEVHNTALMRNVHTICDKVNWRAMEPKTLIAFWKNVERFRDEAATNTLDMVGNPRQFSVQEVQKCNQLYSRQVHSKLDEKQLKAVAEKPRFNGYKRRLLQKDCCSYYLAQAIWQCGLPCFKPDSLASLNCCDDKWPDDCIGDLRDAVYAVIKWFQDVAESIRRHKDTYSYKEAKRTSGTKHKESGLSEQEIWLRDCLKRARGQVRRARQVQSWGGNRMSREDSDLLSRYHDGTLQHQLQCCQSEKSWKSRPAPMFRVLIS